MWSRKSVKKRAKQALRLNYWKTFLVALIMATILGSSGGVSSVSNAASSGAAAAATGKRVTSGQAGLAGITNSSASQSQIQSEDVYGGLLQGTEIETDDSEIPALPSEMLQLLGSDDDQTTGQNQSGLDNLMDVLGQNKLQVFIVLGIIVLAAIVLAVLISAFLLNPLEVGVRRFFFRNLNEKAQIKEVAYGYDNQYGRNVKTLFLRDLYLFFWTLLLIFPGIIKSYSYRMVPYILSDHPELTTREVFALSKDLMRGNKWKAFVLDLSFIGWYILSVFTLGILQVFYVSPYKKMTDAALYERLTFEQQKKKSGSDVSGNLIPQEADQLDGQFGIDLNEDVDE